MRKIAKIEDHHRFKRLMLCEGDKGCYVFFYDKEEDGHCSRDDFYTTVEDAEEYCEEVLGIKSSDWTLIDDPVDGCQHDWISQVRLKRNSDGKPEFRKFEKFVNGKWLAIE